MYRHRLLKLFSLFLLLIASHLQAQNAISLRWDSEVGCQAVTPPDEEGEERKYEELVESSTCLRVCEHHSVTYSLESDDNSNWVSTEWHVVGGTITAQATGSCTVSWGNSGSGSIGATVTTLTGEESLPDLCVEILNGPLAKFGIGLDTEPVHSACLFQDLQFTDLSTESGGSAIISRHWDFGDGTYSNEENPIHHYETPDNYTVTLTVTNGCRCTSTYTMTVQAHSAGINIECPGVLCEGDLATYSLSEDMSTLCHNHFLWSVEGGTILSHMPYTDSIEVRWDDVPDDGFGTVSFDTDSCEISCKSVTTVRIPVIRDNIPISGPTTICNGQQYLYSLPKWPTTEVVWSLSGNGTLIKTDQPNEIIIQTPNRSITDLVLRAVYQNTLLNCGGTATLNISVKPTFNGVDGPTTVCTGIQRYEINADYSSVTADWTLSGSGGVIQSATGSGIDANLATPGNYILSLTNVTGHCDPPPIHIKVMAAPAVPVATTVFGKRIVCPDVPEHYRIENDVPGTVIGWSVTGGSLTGSNYGNDVTVTFDSTYAGAYSLNLWREYNSEPHCRSAALSIPISRPYVDVKVVGTGENAANAATPCPSSYQEYAVVRQDNDAVYTEGEVYYWSILDPGTGSVGAVEGMPDSGDGTPNISVLWNEFSTLTVTKLILRIRKCNVFLDPIEFDITINPAVELTIETPETLCNGQEFTAALSPATDGEVTWYVDGNKQDGSSIAIEDSGSGDHTHILMASVTGINGCPSVYQFTKEVTVHEVPEGDISPKGIRAFCETVVPTVISVYPTQPVGTTITWYKDYVAVGTGATYTATDFGRYWAVLDNGNCQSGTVELKIIDSCDGGTGPGACITTEPIPAIALTAVQQDGCGTIKLTASNLGSYTSTQWNHYGSSCNCSGAEISSSPTAAEYLFAKPDLYIFRYTAAYASTTPGVDCFVTKEIAGIIPYIAKLDYNVTCDGPEGYYNVQLRDTSPFYAGTPHDRREFFVDGVSQGVITTGTTEINTNLAPGAHTLKIKIWRSANDYDPCEYTTTIDLYGFPDATFTYMSATCSSACGEVCSNKSIQLHVTNPHPDETYEWDFGDAVNTQQDPIKTYADYGSKTITLKVSNLYGCESTFSKSVDVKQNLLEGAITVAPTRNCEGETTLLTYENSGLSVPTHFTWMNGASPVPLAADIPTLSVDKSGAYWVKTRDAMGCTSETGTENADFVMVPDAQIVGPNAVCVDQPFTLSGYAGGTSTQYQWLIDDVPVSGFATDNATLSQVLDGSSTPVTYKLRIRISKGRGQYCMTETVKTIHVFGPPDPPLLVIDAISCNPYTVTLHATVPTGSGTFNWSNGASTAADSESVIDVTEGGPFQVRFTNEAGCSATTQIEVPKDPETFLWIFPSGCYDRCVKTADRILKGPIPSFDAWAWTYNASASLPSIDGTGNVPDYVLNESSGTYTLSLTTAGCERESRPLYFNRRVCPTCSEEDISSVIKGVDAYSGPFCHFRIDLKVTNNFGYNANITITPSDHTFGLVTPASITAATGTHTYSLMFYPDSGFTGTSIALYLSVLKSDGTRCYFRQEVTLPGNCLEGEEDDPEGTMERSAAIHKAASLKIAPNPAGHETMIAYAFTGKGSRTVTVYDLSGRELAHIVPDSAEGEWRLNTAGYAPGYYIVVTRQDGRLVRQQKLAIK